MSTVNLSTVKGFDEFTVLPTHPFYIYPFDSLGTQLVSPPFEGTQFVVWRKNMITALSAKNKLGLITSTIPIPTYNCLYFPFYERCNNMIIAWLTNPLSIELATSVMCFDTAKDIWLDINECFGQSNETKNIQLQKEINSTSQGLSSIAAYFTRLRTLWDELHTSYMGPVCTCGALGKLLEQQKLFQFLSGLNDDYSIYKSNILMLPTLPSLSSSYSILQHVEKQNEASAPVPDFSNNSASFNVYT